jgi:hypothetical protein
VSQIQTKFIANNAATNAKLAQAPADTLKGNNTGGTANVSDLTVTQVQTLLSIPTASSPLPISSGGTGQTTANSAFNALAPSTAKGGLIVGSGSNTYANVAVGVDNAILMADSTSTDGAAFLRPSNLKNYVSNPGFESNTTTNWSLGTIGTLTNGIPTGTPTFGSGASGNLTLSTVGSGSQIAGSYSGSYASSTATTQGNMLASSTFSIDTEDQAKVLTVKFYYQVESGAGNGNYSGTSSNSFAWAVYDVTNSVWLGTAGQFGLTQNSGTGYCTGTFQTGLTTTQLRFVLYNANATSGATTLYFDDISIGPQTAPLGPAMTDWVSYTPSFTGFGTVSTSAFWSRRVGDSLEVHGFFQCGTPSGSANEITIGYAGGNGNVTVDTTKVSANILVGDAAAPGFSTTFFRYGILSPSSSANWVQMAIQNSTTALTSSGQAGTSLSLASGQNINMHFLIPIVGWSSNVQMSNDTDTRVVAASCYMSANQNITANSSTAYMNFDTKEYDTHGAITTGTAGSSGTWRFTSPVSGYYTIKAALSQVTSTSTTNYILWKNGSMYKSMGGLASTADPQTAAVATLFLNAGDYVFINSSNSVTMAGGTLSTGNTSNIAIERVSGPAVVAATESVNARYNFVGNTALPSALFEQLTTTYATYTKFRDTHNAFSNGVYTIPVSGMYRASLRVYISVQTANAGQLTVEIAQSGSQILGSLSVTTFGQAAPTSASVSDDFNCNAGDLLTFSVEQNNASSTAISSSVSYSALSIERVGN